MENLPLEYLPIRNIQDGEFDSALALLEYYIFERENNKDLKRLRNKM